MSFLVFGSPAIGFQEPGFQLSSALTARHGPKFRHDLEPEAITFFYF